MRRSFRFFSALAALGAMLAPALAVIDHNATQQVWKLKFGVTAAQLADSAWLDQDSDADGITNRDEIAAGTNPFSPASTIKVSSFVKNGANVELQFPTEVGKRYRAERASSLTGPWTPQAPQVTGNGSVMTLSVGYVANNFYRVRVDDLDSDSDGLADWVEVAVSLSPTAAQTVPGVSDYTYVTGQIALPNVVTIKASAPFASEDGPQAGAFTISRTQKLLPITVNYTPGGTAIAGTDYATLSGSVALAAGADSASISVNPAQDVPPSVEGSKSVTATLVATSLYTLGAPSDATVIIGDSTEPKGTGLTARYYDHANGVYADAANFGSTGTYAFTRGTPLLNTGSIVVTAPASQFTGLQAGHQVKLTFTSGNAAIDNATFDHQIYNVTAVAAGNFTVAIAQAGNFSIGSTSGNCAFSIRSFPHPAVIERVDATVNNDWIYGTPNDVPIAPNNPVDNYSTVYEAYLHPTTAGNYQFQLDADDKARVLLDVNLNGTFDLPGEQILEHGWEGTAETVGTFKQSAAVALAVPGSAAQRYKIRVEHVETTGDARCRLQWREGSNNFANIPQANQFTHTQPLAYNYSGGNAIIIPTGGHSANVSDTVTLAFSTGVLFTPGTGAGTYSTSYTISAVNGTAAVTIPNSSTTAGSATVNVPSTAGLAVGMAVSGTGIPANEFITAIGSGQITITTGTGVTAQASTTLTCTSTYVVPIAGFGIPIAGAATTAGTNIVTVPSTAGLAVGMAISGTGLPANEFITAIGNGTINVTTATGITTQASTTLTATLPAGPVTGAGFVLNNASSATTGVYNLCYPNTAFSDSPGRIGVDAAVTTANNGLWGSGTPSPTLIGKDTFSIRWTGQVQPQFTEDYTIIAHADDGSSLWINGQQQEMKTVPPTNSAIGTYSYDNTTGNVVVTYTNGIVKPDSFVVGESVRVDFTSGNLTHGNGSTYTYDGVTGVLTVDYSNLTNITPGGFNVGETIELDPTAGSLTTLNTLPYVITGEPSTTTFTVQIDPGLFDSQAIPSLINILDTRNASVTAVSAVGSTPTTFTFNVGTGRYLSGSGNISAEIVNKPLKEWATMANERYVRIPMVGGVRYDIQLDYWDNASYARSQLYWYSPNQPKQIIPTERLYPTSITPAPTAHITATSYSGMVGGAISIPVVGSNGGVVSISGNPAWLTYSGGALSGTPPSGAAGDYQVTVTITNAAGTSTSVVNVHVDQNSGNVAREHWNGVYANLAAIPTSTPPAGTSNLAPLAGTDLGEDYGARIRGYLTAPTTGNYYFWIAASNAAELWISNDDEPINALKRASVSTGSATPETWNAEASQKSAWLALEQGRKYYFEVLHKAVAGPDNFAVGWAKPGQSGAAPGEVVPGYPLSTYTPPPPGSTPGTLYVAVMLSQSGAVTNGVGSSTLRLSEDETVAYMRYNQSGLSGIITQQHIHIDPNPGHTDGEIVFDIDTPATPGDGLITNPSDPNFGAYKWTINAVGTYTNPVDLRNAIKAGKAYINLHTALYPQGEIRGNYTLAIGSRTFTPPPAPLPWSDDSNSNVGAARFLTQASYGPNIADLTALKALAATSTSGLYPPSRYETWIDNQFAIPASLHLPEVLRTENSSAQGGAWDESLTFNAWWWKSITGPDQLRQRIAFALSEIHVVSAQGPLDNEARSLSYFYDKLAEGAFGNFRDILETTTLTPGMGRYLDMLRNDKPDQTVGRIPNENYAREIKQLFSVGLFRMWPDGSLMLTSKDTPIDTYKQPEIIGFSHVFTGWDYGYDGALRTGFGAAASWVRQMREVPARHYTGTKRLLNNEVLPGIPSLGGQTLDPIATHTSNLYNDPVYAGLPGQELDYSHDQLFNHPNTGPFICRQLIQRLVTSHPSRDYLYRVVQKFNDNGVGVRGDMKAVIKAVLLDYEARHVNLIDDPGFGKQRESVMRVAAAARAFRTSAWSGAYVQNSTSGRTITVNLTPPATHKLQGTNDSVFLDFDPSVAFDPANPNRPPWRGNYTASVVDADTFTVTAQGWSAVVNYTIPAGSTTCTVSYGGHWAAAGNRIYADFLTVSAGTLPADGIYTVADPNAATNQGTAEDYPINFAGNSFTIPVASHASARTGTLVFPRFSPGSYTVAASGITTPPGQERRITMDTNVNHELVAGDQVSLNFYNAANLANLPNDYVATVESVVDFNTYTFLAPSAGTNFGALHAYDAVYQFPLKSLPLTRSGNIGNRPSTFSVGNTTVELEQSPLNSPTVFNFYLPDYRYPGALASQGLTTPEFQTTAETTVIRQANYLYNGVFGMDNTNGLSSFNNGNAALVMDFSPWYGNATTDGLGAGPQTGQAWTSNANLPTLIDHMSTLLVSGQLSTGVKNRILKFLYQTMTSVSTGSPCTINAPAHGLSVGDTITISGITGGIYMGADTDGNGTFLVSAVPNANSFRLRNTANTLDLNCATTPGTLTAAHFSPVAYTNSGPSDTNKRDRMRAIIHLILAGPDFTTQR